ncbi:MAG: hypothetical protein GY724_16040, partial [Actinomycetia bacterium]|nr:hypothetical protein [Actinomycetes bacterium]
ENNNIAADAAKRRGVRAEGHLVWNLTWDDVEAFHKAALADPPTRPMPRTLLKGRARSVAQRVQAGAGGTFDVDDVNRNPMELLVEVLARPDHDQWRRLALSTIGGLAGAGDGPNPLDGSLVDQALRAAITGETDRLAGSSDDPMALRFVSITSDGLPITLLLDARGGRADQERWTVVSSLDDTLTGANAPDESEHRRRWRDWLHWANVLQLAGGPTTEVVITGASEAEAYPVDELILAATASISTAEADSETEVEISELMEEELDLILDDTVTKLVSRALQSGAPDFEAGPELGGLPLEAAWLELKVAVLGQKFE